MKEMERNEQAGSTDFLLNIMPRTGWIWKKGARMKHSHTVKHRVKDMEWNKQAWETHTLSSTKLRTGQGMERNKQTGGNSQAVKHRVKDKSKYERK